MAEMLITLLIAAAGLVADEPVTTDWLLGQNEEALARVHSLRATVEKRGSIDRGNTWQLLETIWLVRSGSRERVSRTVRAIINQGRFETFSDDFAVWLNAPEGTWDLGGVDPEHPLSESLAYIDREIARKPPRITGRISAPNKRGPHGYNGTPGPTALGLVLRSDLSLRDLRQSSEKVIPIKGRDNRGDPTWVLRLKPPERSFEYEVHLNPKYGYMISAWRAIGTVSANRGLESYWQVEEFQEPVPGVFIAKKIRQTGEDPEFKVPIILASTITVSDVNRPIPDSDLQLRYPAGVLVGDERDQTFNIWGDNGKPALTFKSHSEFKKWRVAQIMQRLKARPAWWQEPAALVVLGAAVLLVMLLIYRRRLTRKQYAAA